MQGSIAAVVGFLAGCLGTYSFVPQVLKCWRSGDSSAVSQRMFALRSFGLILWTVYGFVIGSVPVLVFSALGLALSSAIMVLKVKSARNDAPNQPGRDRTGLGSAPSRP
jgi:MtN3 and saliva related transmembrane protein